MDVYGFKSGLGLSYSEKWDVKKREKRKEEEKGGGVGKDIKTEYKVQVEVLR